MLVDEVEAEVGRVRVVIVGECWILPELVSGPHSVRPWSGCCTALLAQHQPATLAVVA